jgi:hypothetical protein
LTVKYLDEKKIALVDMACPREECVQETKEQEKTTKYQQLRYELRTQHNLSGKLRLYL